MEAASDDQAAIRALIENWSEAVRRKDYDGILKQHAQDMLMFDVPGPDLQTKGIEAYRATWDLFFNWMPGPPKFDFSELNVTAGSDVAFVTAIGRCFGPGHDGKPADLDFRLTLGLRKVDGQWIVTHEHHSVPAP